MRLAAGWAGLAALAAGFAAALGLAGAVLATGLAAAGAFLLRASIRAFSAAMSLAVGTPSLPKALATRSSKMLSSLSHWPTALEPMPVAMLVILLVASVIFSSAATWVLRWMDRPCLTRASKTLLPSSCALAKAPRPASQICWAESLTVPDSWAPGFFSALSFCSFLTMEGSRIKWEMDVCPRSIRARNVLETDCTRECRQGVGSGF